MPRRLLLLLQAGCCWRQATVLAVAATGRLSFVPAATLLCAESYLQQYDGIRSIIPGKTAKPALDRRQGTV